LWVKNGNGYRTGDIAISGPRRIDIAISGPRESDIAISGNLSVPQTGYSGVFDMEHWSTLSPEIGRSPP
jgi:hypothetical protein